MSVIESVLLYRLGSVLNMATGVCCYYTGLQPKMPGRFVFSDSTTFFLPILLVDRELKTLFQHRGSIYFALSDSFRTMLDSLHNISFRNSRYIHGVEHVCFPLWFVNFPDSPLFSPSLSLNYKVYLCRRFHLNNKFVTFLWGMSIPTYQDQSSAWCLCYKCLIGLYPCLKF